MVSKKQTRRGGRRDEGIRRFYGLFAGLILVISVGSVLAYAYWPQGQTGQEPLLHWHFDLIINDARTNTNITIPANIGISSSLWVNRTLDVYGLAGRAPLHTTDETGRVHIEANALKVFRLVDFFNIWVGNGRLTTSCVLDYCAGPENPPPFMSTGPKGGALERCLDPRLVLQNEWIIVILLGSPSPLPGGCPT